MAKNYTNYDAISLMKDCVKDDKLRFPFVASCVLTGSFRWVHNRDFTIGNIIDDMHKLYFAEGMFERFNPVFSVLNESKEGDVTGLIEELTPKYFEELYQEIEKYDGEIIFRRCSQSDLYTYSLRFGIVIAKLSPEIKDMAEKSLGQRIEQIIINAYKNLRLETNPNKRTPDKYKKAMKEEGFYSANKVQDAYERFM